MSKKLLVVLFYFNLFFGNMMNLRNGIEVVKEFL